MKKFKNQALLIIASALLFSCSSITNENHSSKDRKIANLRLDVSSLTDEFGPWDSHSSRNAILGNDAKKIVYDMNKLGLVSLKGERAQGKRWPYKTQELVEIKNIECCMNRKEKIYQCMLHNDVENKWKHVVYKDKKNIEIIMNSIGKYFGNDIDGRGYCPGESAKSKEIRLTSLRCEALDYHENSKMSLKRFEGFGCILERMHFSD